MSILTTNGIKLLHDNNLLSPSLCDDIRNYIDTQEQLEKLETFSNGAIYSYQEQRNFPGLDGTSQLSAALKFGAIGIRTVWAKTQELIENCRSDEAFKNIETWQKEIAWREFYQYVMYH